MLSTGNILDMLSTGNKKYKKKIEMIFAPLHVRTYKLLFSYSGELAFLLNGTGQQKLQHRYMRTLRDYVVCIKIILE
jgi:hypothetical protein